MKHLLNYNYDTLSCGYASPRKCYYYGIEAAIIGGIVAGVGAAAGGAAQAAGMSAANADNADLTREGWDLQSKEAELARRFNAAEAEKARDYYSEVNIMKRRSEAGLNTAMVAGQSATSGPAATGPAASIGSPIPMQNVGAGVGAAIQGAADTLSNAVDASINYKKSAKDLENTDANTKKTIADTQKVLDDNVRAAAIHNMTLEQINLQIENALKDGTFKDLQNEGMKITLAAERQGLDNVSSAMYNAWRETKMKEANIKFEAGKFMFEYQRDMAEIKNQGKQFILTLKQQKEDMRYKYGRRRIYSAGRNQTDGVNVNHQEGSNNMWNVNGKIAGSAGFKGVASASAEISGGYQSSSSEMESKGYSTTNSMSTNDQFEEHFANTDVGRELSKAEGYMEILESPVYSEELKREAAEGILHLNLSVRAWAMEMQQINAYTQSMYKIK